MDDLFDVFENQPQAVRSSDAGPRRSKKDKRKRQVNGAAKEDEDTVIPDALTTKVVDGDAEYGATEDVSTDKSYKD